MSHPLLETGSRLVIGHRGNAMYAPENTLTSIEQAITSGADAVEIDVRLSADGQAVVIHDSTLDRTTNGTGPVAGHSLRELQRLDAGARFSPDAGMSHPYRGQSIRIPTLAEVLHSFPSAAFAIELKTAAAQGAVLRTLRDLDAMKRVVLASFDARALDELRRDGMLTGASRPELLAMFARSILRLAQGKFAFNAVFMPRRFVGMPLSVDPVLRAASPASIPVHAWVENDPRAAVLLWKAGISGIVTDDPGALKRVTVHSTSDLEEIRG